MHCKTETLTTVGHVGRGEPWRGGTSSGEFNMTYTVRPLTPADRAGNNALTLDQQVPPSHGVFSDLFPGSPAWGWCRRMFEGILSCDAPGDNKLGIDLLTRRFYIFSPGDYLNDGRAAATMELGSCEREPYR